MPNRSEFQIERDRFGIRVSNKGVRSKVRHAKYAEAFARNARTPHHRTKQHRLRCSVFGKSACPDGIAA